MEDVQEASGMKILFVWRKIDMVAGGVERFMSSVMNEMVARGHDVRLMTWDRSGAQSYYPLDNRVKWHRLDTGDPAFKGNWTTRFKRMKLARHYIRPDPPAVILCFESGIFFSTRMFLAGFKIPMISAERNAPSRHSFSTKFHSRLSTMGSLALADRITVQFERYRDDYPVLLRKRIKAISNPVHAPEQMADPRGEEGKAKILLCASRLSSHQKNPEVLLKAFSDVFQKHKDWKLVMAGEGSDAEREHLTRLSKTLGIEQAVEFPGAVKDIGKLYASAHLFCLPSRYEGFPNALAEALSHGIPSVGFSGCAGVADLIQDNVSGLLAAGNDNAESLADALDALMQDDDMRARMGKSAAASMQAYQPKKIFDQWESFLKETAGL